MTQQQREQIIIQARNMYLKEGLKMVRMDDIARSVGISKRTLYEAFGDKETLIFQAMSYHINQMEQEHKEIALQSPNILVAIMSVMEHTITHSEQNWKLISSIRRLHPAVHKRLISDGEGEKRKQFLYGLQTGVEDGLLNPKANLDLAISMLQFFSISLVMGSEDLDLPQGVTSQMAFREIMVNVMRGLSTTKGIEIIDNYIENIKA